MSDLLSGRRVLLVNAFSYRNAGDAAIMIATRDLLTDLGAREVSLSSRYPDLDHYARHRIPVHGSLVPFPPRASGTAGNAVRLLRVLLSLALALAVITTHRLQPNLTGRVAARLTPRAVTVVGNHDLLAIAGGGYMYSSRRRLNVSLWQSLVTIRLGQALIPASVMLPQSIGPIDNAFDARLMNWALSRTTVVLRERRSLNGSRALATLRLGATIEAPDTAFYGLHSLDLPVDPPPGPDAPRRIRVVVMDWRWSPSSSPEGFDRYLDTVAEIADELVRAGHAVVVGGHSSVPEQDQDDISWAHEVSRRTSSGVPVDIDTDVQHLWNVYRSSHLVIGTRLHACIMALAAGTPAIALGYQQKTAGVMAQIGREDCVFPADDLEVEPVVARAVQLLELDRRHSTHLARHTRDLLVSCYAGQPR